MSSIGVKIKMMFVWVILKMFKENIGEMNEEIKRLTTWGNEQNCFSILLGGIGAITVRLEKQDRSWWITVSWDGYVHLKDKLTNGFYAFNKKTVERLIAQYNNSTDGSLEKDLKHLEEYIKGFDYLSQTPEFGLLDRITKTELKVVFTPHEDFGNYIQVSGVTSRYIRGQYFYNLDLGINRKYAHGFVGDVLVETMLSVGIVNTVTKSEFNNSVGSVIAGHFVKVCSR